METKRLHSYIFNCPCCSQPHARLFEYYAKFRGLIPENEPLKNYPDATMIERVVMDEENFAGRSLSIGESVFRCGNCYEFFKFDDHYSEPTTLTVEEKECVQSKFRPVSMFRVDAIKNAFDMLKKLTYNNGYQINEFTGEISFNDANGRKYTFKIGDALVDGFFKDNPNFEIKDTLSVSKEKSAEIAESQKGAV